MFQTLGRPGSEDVFVTAAEDIAGLNASQISKRLGIPGSKEFTVIEFPTSNQRIATPIRRDNPGFVGKGRTSDEAREFVIPNQKIPEDAEIRIVK